MSTHVHSGPDVLGQWGRLPIYRTNERYQQEQLLETIVEGVQEAWGAREEATMGSIDTSMYSEEKRIQKYHSRFRDPKIIDTELGVAHFINETGDTIATMVSFGNHPEVLTGSSLGITSDFTDATDAVEDGITYPERESFLGFGICVYVSAAAGGMMSPLRVVLTDGSGSLTETIHSKSRMHLGTLWQS